LRVDRSAEGFEGLPDGVKTHGHLLGAFKAAAPSLGLSARMVHAVDWLFRFTQPQDWGRGGRPIVWPSALMQQEALALSPTRVKATNRALIEAGLITMKDSPNGKRYGKRDGKGNIIEAYGFDLSPIAARYQEFLRLAADARTEREDMRRLRRRATIARKGIAQVLDTVAEYGLAGEAWTNLARETGHLVAAAKRLERSEEMALAVESLERRQRLARERLELELQELMPSAPEPVHKDPLGTENGPHQYTYKPNVNSEQNTVIASREGSSDGGEREAQPPAPVRAEKPDGDRVLRLFPSELVRLAPRLRPYVAGANPTWREIVDAADWLRHDLDVSKSLWGEACLALGREPAAIALAVVSAKDGAHFRTSAAGYFHGMVTKAKAGELNLDRTIWAMRRAADPKPPNTVKAAEKPRPSSAPH
jgi:replication initiation protein RepC